MKGNDLRLRLVVRRHALPEARVVFNVPLDNDPTVARLLEQVNDIIPLESSDWGLEDYVVELHDAEGHAFDCLHFQPVAAVLKNDEEVFIRPLFTEDRKRRLLSGRHQISNDGKHLIDGVPFGRPRHRAPKDRPAVDIPPLKRRRLTYDDPEDLAKEDEDTQLLLTERGYGDAEEDGDDDDEFVADDADDLDEDMDDPAVSELEAELQDLEKDNALAEEDTEELGLDTELEGLEMGNSQVAEEDLEAELRDLQTANAQLAEEEQEFRQESQRPEEPEPAPELAVAPPTMLELLDLDRIAALRAAFPTAPVDVCEKTLLKSNKDESVAYKKLKRRNKPHKSLNEMLAYYDSLHPLHRKPQVEADDELDDGSGAESVDSLVKHYDEHGFPAGSILDGTASVHMAETLRKAGHLVKLPVRITFDDGQEGVGVESAKNKLGSKDSVASVDNESEEESQRTDSDDDEATSDSGDFSSSESDNDDSDSGSDSGPEEESAKDNTHVQDLHDLSSDSDSGGDSDSDSDIGSDSSDESTGEDVEMAHGNHPENAASSAENSDGSDSDSSDSESSSSDDSSDDDDSDSSSGDQTRPKMTDVGPSTSSAQPSSATPGQQSRGAQPESRGPPSASNQTQSAVPPGQGKSATQRRNARRRTALKIKQAEAKGISLPHHSPSASQSHDGTTDQALADSLNAKKAALLKSLASLSQMASNDDMDLDTEATGGAQSPALAPTPASEPASTASQRKSKLDVGAGRRMLFGALGLKNPKTKADEDDIRSKLMEDVRPLVNHRLQNSNDNPSQTASTGEPAVEEEDPDAWREKINYRAVECCEDGVNLSEPPFPFVQRWDPQQQYNGGRSKRKQRNQQAFYEDDSQHSAKKRKVAENGSYDDTHEESYFEGDSYWTNGEITLNYDEPQETHDQSMAEADQGDNYDDEQDLPPLPEDLSTLPALQTGEVKHGMVVTWKQLLMSKATNWQPQVSSLTGSVVDVYEDGAFRVMLAKRDRNLDQNAKIYDDEGNRVYDKFEVPDMDEDQEDGAELGYRTVDFLDMMEPRVLVQPSKDAVEATSTPPRREETRSTSGDQSTTLDHEKPSEESVIPETNREESLIPETNHESTGEVQGAQLSPAVDISPLTEERRHEISLLINDAGFRKDVDPSIIHKADSVQSLSSPSRQLEQMSHEAAAASDAPSPRLPSMEPAASPQAAAASSMYVDSQPLLLEPFSGFSEFDTEPVSEARAEYPKLDLPPSDTGSSDYAHASGRQPDPDFSIDLGNEFSDQLADDSGLAGAANTDDGHDIASTHQPEGGDPERTPTKPTSLKLPTHESPAVSESSINSFPSLSEVWITASTSNSGSQNSAAVLSAIKARKSDVAPDLEYEEAMRRLDNKHDDDDDDMDLKAKFRFKRESVSQSQDAGAAVRKLMDQAIEKPQPKTKTKKYTSPVKTERASIGASSRHTRLSESPRLPRLRKLSSTTDKGDSSFVIPKGFQVVSLVTSSPEPEPVEYYPDNDIDESYVATAESSSLPEGDGWVRKLKHRELRGGSLPAPAAAAAAVAGRVPAQKKTGSSSQQVRRGASLGGGGIVKAGISKKKTFTRKF